MEKKLTVNKNVEIRKLVGEEDSGFLQVPTVKANEVVPLAPETKVKIVSLTRNLTTPTVDNRIELYGGAKISGDTVIEFDNTLFVDKLEKTGELADALTINSKTKIEGDVIVATSKTLSVDTIKPIRGTDVTLDCGIDVEGNIWINPSDTVSLIASHHTLILPRQRLSLLKGR